jgi:hypothetical protein
MQLNQILTALILGSALGTLRNLPPYQALLSLLNLNRKPLNCAMCLTFWTSIAMGLFHFNWPLVETFFIALAAGFMADQVDKINQKLF